MFTGPRPVTGKSTPADEASATTAAIAALIVASATWTADSNCATLGLDPVGAEEFAKGGAPACPPPAPETIEAELIDISLCPNEVFCACAAPACGEIIGDELFEVSPGANGVGCDGAAPEVGFPFANSDVVNCMFGITAETLDMPFTTPLATMPGAPPGTALLTPFRAATALSPKRF